MLPPPEILRYIETEVLPLLTTARSDFPSPSKSAMATEMGLVPAAKSTFAIIS